jgi:hypothetical protein
MSVGAGAGAGEEVAVEISIGSSTVSCGGIVAVSKVGLGGSLVLLATARTFSSTISMWTSAVGWFDSVTGETSVIAGLLLTLAPLEARVLLELCTHAFARDD